MLILNPMDFPFLQIFLTWLTALMELASAESLLDLLTEPSSYSKVSSERICSGGLIERSEGIIISPMYPSQYPNHISCTWHIANNERNAVMIRFHDLNIEESGTCDTPPCCDYNWVKIGPSVNGSENQYCGQNKLPYPGLVSYASKVWIKFHISRVINGGRGFKLFFTIGKRKAPFCHENEFICENSECVPRNVQCNGLSDCSDGSDEKYCSGICPSGKSCKSVYMCYSDEEHCDGNANCPDFSDEIGCGFCSANETHCGGDSQQCFNPLTQRCDRVMDCQNAADEKDCLHGCPSQIMCSSGIGCYSAEERCNGVTQCSDSSDEKNCGLDLCNYDRGGFLCSNGHCIREIWKCDRTNDCGDGSDEHNCLRNSVLTAAVLGSLICGLLLVIAVSCVCRLYALRSYENSMVPDQETILPRINQEFLFREPPPSYAVSVGEHQRSLCIENIHYNPCSRRSRRRIRRARRSRDSCHPPFAQNESRTAGSQVSHLNQQLPQSMQFPFLTTLPTVVDGGPTTDGGGGSTLVVQHPRSGSGAPMPSTGPDTMGNGNITPAVHNSKNFGKTEKDLYTTSKNAESSFSEVAQKAEDGSHVDGHKEDSTRNTTVNSSNPCPINASDNSSFHDPSFHNTDINAEICGESLGESQTTVENYCDSDTQNLIT